jgi:hypothetical protein
LKKDIQQGSSGHGSFEDASACIELMLWKIRMDELMLWKIRMDLPMIVQFQAQNFSLI